MINVINTASDAMITPSTVADIGICYYDYDNETIMELSSIAINMCSVSPVSPIIKKYYLISADVFASVSVALNTSEDDKRYFGAKIIANEIEPTIADFDGLVEFNSTLIANPLQNHLIPIWILVSPKVSANMDIQMTINLEAE